MALDFSQFEWLSFDCYGTLIDWESGILGALRPAFVRHNRTVSDAEMLAQYSELEPAIQQERYLPYREVLQEVVRRMGQRNGFTPSSEEAESLPRSLGNWRPFPDTVAALGRLKSRYKLAILSNVDDDLFALTARHLKVPFDAVVTAQQAGSYKPSLQNFNTLLTRIRSPREKLLHAAQSVFHDVAPARSLGISTVWVNRRAGRSTGATRAMAVDEASRPDLEVPSLEALAVAAGV